jgi:heptosyltransferase II
MSEKILICGVNWLGDAVMSMPAVQELRRRCPAAKIAIVAKEKLVSLWLMHAAVDEVIPLRPGSLATLMTAYRLRARGYDRAYVFPNSFRSALVAFVAGVPVRVGPAGHCRAWMLTQVAQETSTGEHRHQAWEHLSLVNAARELSQCPAPRLMSQGGLIAESRDRFGVDDLQPWLALIPGAARGPAKRWPLSRFVEVGRGAEERYGCRCAVFGTGEESGLCAEVVQGIGSRAVNAAGKTSLRELAALLSVCDVALTNDSGGMHLAAAVGTKVVAVFGITDPDRTGPLGDGHRIMAAEGVERSRDLAPDSPAALEALLSIPPDPVLSAVGEALAGDGA